MKKFETKVQQLKYKVLCEVSRLAYKDALLENLTDIPKTIVPGKEATMRCCVYKERAILAERVKLAMGGDKRNPNIVEVIDIACDDCPVGGYAVTDACRGCIAHHCESVCRLGAISFDNLQKAHIDKTKCVECGACAKVCPYSAIVNYKRPCENACHVKAISMREDHAARIDEKKCINCGACIYQCPFGAIMDKSFILNVIDLLKRSKNNTAYNMYAIVAPSIAGQFEGVETGQIFAGIKKLGFLRVVEVALGADMVAYSESNELAEKGFLTSSCCPAFVEYVKRQFPELEKYISHNLSPMAMTGFLIKEKDPTARVVFIGPCTAKKSEFQKPEVRRFVDSVITFEELQALLDSRDIDLVTLEAEKVSDASYFGRVFARSGGLTEAVAEGLRERGKTDFEFKPQICNGIASCKAALLKAGRGALDANFIEGMACVGGCIGGAGCLTHGEKGKSEIDRFGSQAEEKIMSDASGRLKNKPS